ncbi:hypothetical protein ATANTOWER_007646 [Ataeniobius toweri]|uniref:Uncharacterized protein n=1 Tax=Ataeniobius toweri TaxID=208326 RepID=A0ABU7A1V4_9TELE|nr:hypothetical protein [Ataeniobius toweri]
MFNLAGRFKPLIPSEPCSLIVLTSSMFLPVSPESSPSAVICAFQEKSGYCLVNKKPFDKRMRTSQKLFWTQQTAPSPQPLPACPLSISVQATHGPLKTTWLPCLKTHGSIATRIISLPFSLCLPKSPMPMNPIA